MTEIREWVLNRECGVEVDDLYPVTAVLGREFHADWVHYNDQGAEIIANAVIRSFEKDLSADGTVAPPGG